VINKGRNWQLKSYLSAQVERKLLTTNRPFEVERGQVGPEGQLLLGRASQRQEEDGEAGGIPRKV